MRVEKVINQYFCNIKAYTLLPNSSPKAIMCFPNWLNSEGLFIIEKFTEDFLIGFFEDVLRRGKDLNGRAFMDNRESFEVGFVCPHCLYTRNFNSLIKSTFKFHPKNTGMSEVCCPICKDVTLLKEWAEVKYPIKTNT